MANAITNSFAVFKESLLILNKDKKILLFPISAGVASLAAIISFILPTFLAIDFIGLFSLLLVFACYLIVYFLCIFFSSAMVIYVSLRIQGGDPSVFDGIKEAGKNVLNILRWALFSATIGIILELIDTITRERFDILNSILGIVWSLAAFFIIPVMIFEKKTPLNALKASAVLFKKRWGEAITGMVGIGLPIIIMGLIGFLVLIGATQILPEAIVLSMIFIFISYVILLVFLYSTLNSIYVAALYHFATTGEVRGGFSEETIRNAGISPHVHGKK